VPLHKFRDIEFGFLQDLDFPDEAILNGEDAGTLLGNVVSNGRTDEFLDETLEVSLGSEFGHDGCHFGSNGTTLGGFGVARGRDLVVLGPSEGDAKETDDVAVGCSAIHVGFNDGLLLSDEGAELVAGHVHAVEVQQAVVSLDVFDAELDFAVRQGFVLLEVRQGDFDHTALQVLRGNLGSLSLGDEGLAAVLDAEDGRGDQLVPFLLGEGIDGLFTATLFGFCQSLVLADSHLDLLLLQREKRRICTATSRKTGRN